MNRLKLTEGYPVVNLIGAAQSKRGKFYAGVVRACFNGDAVIVDSAIETGLEPYVIRKGKYLKIIQRLLNIVLINTCH